MEATLSRKNRFFFVVCKCSGLCLCNFALSEFGNFCCALSDNKYISSLKVLFFIYLRFDSLEATCVKNIQKRFPKISGINYMSDWLESK